MRIGTCILLLQLFLFSCTAGETTSATKVKPSTSSLAKQEGGPALQRTEFASFDGTKISYLDGLEGEPVILLHGFLNTAASWAGTPLVDQLQRQGFRAIIPDLRGNGESGKPQTDAAYADNAEVKDLQLLLDHLKLDSVRAVGYSRGSIVLTKWLTEEPRITRAVIGGMGVDFTDPEWPRRKAFAAAFGGAEPTELTGGAVAYARSIDADFPSLRLQQLHQPVTSPEEIRRITIPVIVIAGNEDKDNGNPGRLEQLFPSGKLNILPGDHDGTYRTEIFGAAAMAFLKQG